ncbi:MAG TPA: ribose 5-phosphate isomerase B [Coriobacteriia bacterium]|nr:ribose 5-phosphate isomerase B [Coriobacteriia bacterium]
MPAEPPQSARQSTSQPTQQPTQQITVSKVAIASDHAGVAEKARLVEWMKGQGIEVLDLGPATDDRVDYPDFAAKVAGAVTGGTVETGVLVCGTGIGMAIAANKLPGIRAANVTSPEFAALAREHNDANIVAVSARFSEPQTNERILATFFSTDFGGGRHAGRVQKITDLEAGPVGHDEETASGATDR